MAQDFDVGHRLREIRQKNNLSQRQLAELAGVPHGQISMIETNKSSPSVASLRRILGGFGVTMGEFFEPETSTPSQNFFTPNELRDLTAQLYGKTADGAGKLSIRQVGDAKAHDLQILHECYDVGADTGPELIEHPSSEGGLVIRGEIEVTIGDEVRTLKAGDSYLFDSRQPHRFRNISDRPAEIVSACTPPYL